MCLRVIRIIKVSRIIRVIRVMRVIRVIRVIRAIRFITFFVTAHEFNENDGIMCMCADQRVVCSETLAD